MSRFVRSPLPLLLAVAGLALTGCDVSPTFTVGPDGGTIEVGGVGLEIPAGALDEEVEIGVEVLVDLEDAGYAAIPSFVDGVPEISIALTPHGTTFNEPVTLTLPFAGEPDNLAVLRAASPDAPEWDAVGPIAVADGLATLSIDGFSVYTRRQGRRAGWCPRTGW
ncbi:MAG: hypothetical protein GY898_05545 [Proteobacteria bacterium]|nr:hypothetical protein [Pseudomonadota bacterium]